MSDGEIASAFSWPKVWLIINAAGHMKLHVPERTTSCPICPSGWPHQLPLPELPQLAATSAAR